MRTVRALAVLVLLGTLATGATPDRGETSPGEVVVAVGGTATIDTSGFPRHEVIDSAKVDVSVAPHGLTLYGREPGETSLIVWDRANRPHRYKLRVVPSGTVDNAADKGRESAIQAALAADEATRGAGLQVRVFAGRATLSGTVGDPQVAERAVALAQAKADQVINQIQVQGATPPPPAPPGPRTVARPTPLTVGPVPPPVATPVAERTPVALTPERHTEPIAPLPEVGIKFGEMQKWEPLELAVGQATTITVPTQLYRVLVADPETADVVTIPPDQVAVTAKAPGQTTLILWYRGVDTYLGQVESARIDVHVLGAPGPDPKLPGNLPAQEEIDHVLKLLGVEGVEVVTRYSESEPSVLLIGEVATWPDRTRVEQAVAALFPVNARITSFLEIRPPEAMQPEQLQHRAEALEELLAKHLPNAAVRVRLRADPGSDRIRVLLTGDAAVPSDRMRAEQLVRFELGETATIENQIVTPLPPPPGDIFPEGTTPQPKRPMSEVINEALEMSGVPHERVWVEVYDPQKRVVVGGHVQSDEQREDLVSLLTDAVSKNDSEYELVDRGLMVRVPRVVTQVEIVEMSSSDIDNFGVIWGVPIGGNTGGGGGGGGGGGSSTQGATSVSNANGALTTYGESTVGAVFGRIDPMGASVRALIQNNRARVLSRPNITTDNNEEGRAEIVTEIPLPSTTIGAGGGTGTSVEFRPVGIRLTVTPKVIWSEPRNQVQMTLETEVSALDFGSGVNIGGSFIPAVTNRHAETVVTVDDSSMLVIGGLTTETERKNVSRLPFLSDIPVIGNLFRYTDKKKEQTTVVIVMTPKIMW